MEKINNANGVSTDQIFKETVFEFISDHLEESLMESSKEIIHRLVALINLGVPGLCGSEPCSCTENIQKEINEILMGRVYIPFVMDFPGIVTKELSSETEKNEE